MNTRKFLLSGLAGFVGLLVTTFLFEEVIFKTNISAMYQSIGAAGFEFSSAGLLSFLAPLSMVLIMAYMYPKGYEGGSPTAEGLRFGVLLGLFLGIAISVFLDLLFGIGMGAVLLQILVTVLEFTAAGLAIAIVYGRN